MAVHVAESILSIIERDHAAFLTSPTEETKDPLLASLKTYVHKVESAYHVAINSIDDANDTIFEYNHFAAIYNDDQFRIAKHTERIAHHTSVIATAAQNLVCYHNHCEHFIPTKEHPADVLRELTRTLLKIRQNAPQSSFKGDVKEVKAWLEALADLCDELSRTAEERKAELGLLWAEWGRVWGIIDDIEAAVEAYADEALLGKSRMLKYH